MIGANGDIRRIVSATATIVGGAATKQRHHINLGGQKGYLSICICKSVSA